MAPRDAAAVKPAAVLAHAGPLAPPVALDSADTAEPKPRADPMTGRPIRGSSAGASPLLPVLRKLDDTLGYAARAIWATPNFGVFNVLYGYWMLPPGERLPSVPHMVLNYIITTSLIGLCMSVCLHRFFSHGAFRTSRVGAFMLAVFSTMACQRGPVWWASKHIRHHAHCDNEADPHSPVLNSKFDTVAMWGSREAHVDWTFVPPRLRLPELYLVDTFFFIPPILYFLAIYYLSGKSHYAVLYYGLNPHFFCVLITSIFNARYHDIEETISSTTCKGVDRVSDLMANLVGENLHMEHHLFPRLAQRHKADMPYWAMIYPLKKLGVVWEVDYNGVARACERDPVKGGGAMGVVSVGEKLRSNEEVPFGFVDVYWGAFFTSAIEVIIGLCAVYVVWHSLSPLLTNVSTGTIAPPPVEL